MVFYENYFKKASDEATEYKIEYLNSIITDNTIYKFIQFDENKELNNLKLNALKKEVLWFSYYRYLNDKTEFKIKYSVKQVSKETNMTYEYINNLFKIMKELYDICSFSYKYFDYMWDEYSNHGNGICLEFGVNNLDILFPIDYVKKDKINFTKLISKSINNFNRKIKYNDPMALLPFVVKNPYNGTLDSTKEKEVRILYSPFDKEECNNGIITQNIKTEIGYKGINVNYTDIGLNLKKIIIGNNCDSDIKQEINNYAIKKHLSISNRVILTS